jgi:hypothetical protein
MEEFRKQRGADVTFVAALTAALAVSLSACGPQDAVSSTSEGSDDEIAATKQALYGDTSGCRSPTLAVMSYKWFNANTHGDVWSTEGTGARPANCNAWYTRYINQAVGTSAGEGMEAFFSTIPYDPMPGDATNCAGVWRSEQMWTTMDSQIWYDAKDSDSYASWSGSVCLFGGEAVTPNFPGYGPRGGDMLWLTQAVATEHPWYEWLKVYQRIDSIAQPWWIYWPLRANTYASVHH